MKVVKVDGTVYIGKLGENAVTEAMAVGTANMAQNLDKRTVSLYTRQDNLGELISVGFGTSSAVSSRPLNEDEEQLFAQAKFAMEIVKRKALKNLENQLFESTFGGK